MSAARTGGPRPLFRSIGLHAQVVALLAIAVSPIGAVGTWQAVRAAKETAVLNENALIDRTRLAAEEERAALTAAFGAAKGLSAGLALGSESGDVCSGTLRGFVGSDPRYVFGAVIEPDGKIVCSSAAGGEVPDFISALIANEMTDDPDARVSLFKRGLSLDTVTLTVLNPIYRDGGLIATLALSMPASLIRTVTLSTDDEAGFRLALLDQRGRIFAEDSDQLGDANWTPEGMAFGRDDLPVERVMTHTSRAGERRSYAIVPIIAGDVYALGSWRDSDLRNAASNRIWSAVLFPASMWALALGVSYFAVYRLAVRHITYLRRILRAFQGGRRNLRAIKLETASSQLSELGRAFDQMAETIERDERELRRALEEKNTLLKEVYHRVKNNLQLVVSMMNMQMRKSISGEERSAIMRLQERVMGLAAVHQRLYQAGDLTAVRCDELLSEIATNICETAGTPASVALELDLRPLLLGPDQAIPLALFATECMMNGVKHGRGAGGTLRVSLTEAADGQVTFSVANAVAPGAAAEPPDTGIGSQLIEAFGRQLNGRIEVERLQDRHRISLTFPAGPSG